MRGRWKRKRKGAGAVIMKRPAQRAADALLPPQRKSRARRKRLTACHRLAVLAAAATSPERGGGADPRRGGRQWRCRALRVTGEVSVRAEGGIDREGEREKKKRTIRQLLQAPALEVVEPACCADVDPLALDVLQNAVLRILDEDAGLWIGGRRGTSAESAGEGGGRYGRRRECPPADGVESARGKEEEETDSAPPAAEQTRPALGKTPPPSPPSSP